MILLINNNAVHFTRLCLCFGIFLEILCVCEMHAVFTVYGQKSLILNPLRELGEQIQEQKMCVWVCVGVCIHVYCTLWTYHLNQVLLGNFFTAICILSAAEAGKLILSKFRIFMSSYSWYHYRLEWIKMATFTLSAVKFIQLYQFYEPLLINRCGHLKLQSIWIWLPLRGLQL